MKHLIVAISIALRYAELYPHGMGIFYAMGWGVLRWWILANEGVNHRLHIIRWLLVVSQRVR